MTTLNEFKKKAKMAFGGEVHNITTKHPIEFLYSIDNWNIPVGPAFSEEEVTKMNLNFDTRGCFARTVRAAVLVEEYFPLVSISLGEVCEDLLCKILVNNAKSTDWNNPSYLEEILQYENPHLVITYKDKQFDPLFKMFGREASEFNHPSILSHDLWEGLYCSYLISEALLIKNDNDLSSFFAILNIASEICPEMLLIKENLASAYYLINNINKAILLEHEVVSVRKDAKTLFFLYILTESEIYKNRIINEYSIYMFNHLKGVFSYDN